MNKEIWKDITGYEGLYQVSDQGRVKSLKRKDCLGRTIQERILKTKIDRYGYLQLNLHAYGKQKTLTVHRLICEAFNENPEGKPEVNHINENKTDNRACNLEWCTRKENVNHGTRNERVAKANSKQVWQYTLDGELVKVWKSPREAGKQGGFDHGAISNVANGKRKTHKGFVWKYVFKEVIK